MLYDSSSKDQKRILLVAVSLMIAVSVIVLALTLRMLYQSNFEQRVEGLRAMVQEQVSLIESVARFNQQHSSGFSGGSKAATLSQVIEEYSSLGGFGETGEFVLGVRRGDQIEFLSEFRFAEKGARKIVSLTTDRAAPMRRALNNEPGWMIGADYRGERVLAAFQPIKELDLGLVAKLDMREVTAPFMKTAATALGIAALIVIIGGLLILRMARPMVRRIEEIQQRFRSLLESAPDAMVIINASGTIVMVNRRTEELFGYSRDEMAGQPIEILIPQRFREQHPDRVRAFFANPSARSMGSGLELFGCSRAGREFPVVDQCGPYSHLNSGATGDSILVNAAI